MPNLPSPDETRETCRKLLDTPKLRPVCHYCRAQAEQPGTLATLSAGWDTRPGPAGVHWWRCPACRAEDERPREVLVIPVQVERRLDLYEWAGSALADLLFALYLALPVLLLWLWVGLFLWRR